MFQNNGKSLKNSDSTKEKGWDYNDDPDDIPVEAPPLEPIMVDFSIYKEEQLLDLLRRLEEVLPGLSISELNMERELAIQLAQLKSLQGAIQMDKFTPVNQKAQVANSIGAVLSKLLALQLEVYTSERHKRLELELVKLLRGWDTAESGKLLEELQRRLENAAV